MARKGRGLKPGSAAGRGESNGAGPPAGVNECGREGRRRHGKERLRWRRGRRRRREEWEGVGKLGRSVRVGRKEGKRDSGGVHAVNVPRQATPSLGCPTLMPKRFNLRG
jgi:hypothetical protein